MGTFLIDSQLLLDLYYDKETTCRNPKFKHNIPQYYYLSNVELLNYLTFRWKIKKGIQPKNNHVNFLVLYLMEIINGLYGHDFKTKKNLLDSTLSLYPKGVKLRNVIKEAYEILFLQNNSILLIDEYKSSINLKVLDDFFYIPFEDNLENGKRMIPGLEIIFKILKIKKELKLSDAEEFLIRSSYGYLYQMINDQIEMEYYDSLDDLTACTLKLSSDGVFNKLRSTFSIETICNFVLKIGKVEEIEFGDHYSFLMDYHDIQKEHIYLFFKYYLNSIKFWCGNNSSNDTPFRIKIDSENYNDQVLIDDSIKQWVSKNTMVKDSLNCSVDEIIQRLNQKIFKLDIGDVGKVREKSHEIQNKLIIEEDYDEFPMKKTSTPIIKDTVVNETISGLCMSFTKLQRQVIFLLLEENVLAAEVLVASDNKMLSIMIDEINELSTGIIGDVIIIDYQVVDEYKDELIKDLSKNN